MWSLEKIIEMNREQQDDRSRLQILCELHGADGGTIWQYNEMYGVDFLAISDEEFKALCHGIEWTRGLIG